MWLRWWFFRGFPVVPLFQEGLREEIAMPVRKRELGMGLGLAIVRLIVENRWATRNPAGGATMEFDLPVKLDAESRN
jgi:K+-sensing histidine kinase KdpD